MSTPSTCAQFLPGSEFFALDERPPGMRWIELYDDGSIETEVSWVPLMTARAWLALLAAALPAGLAAADPAAWRMTGRNGSEVTLSGSMHVLRPSDYPLPADGRRAPRGADRIVMEIDLDDFDAVAQQRLVLETAMLPQGTVFEDVLDEDVYRLAEQHMGALGVDVTALERFEPWFLAITALDLGMRKLGFQSERGVEQYVVGRARASGKEIVGLETIEFQMDSSTRCRASNNRRCSSRRSTSSTKGPSCSTRWSRRGAPESSRA